MNVTIDHAQTHLADLIAMVARGESVVITDNEKPVARLVAEGPPGGTKQSRTPGSARGQLTILQDDDEHLRDFAEYMQ